MLFVMHTHKTAEINYEGLDVASAANYHLSRVGWPQSVRSHPSSFSRLPLKISCQSAASKLDEEPGNVLPHKYTVTTNLGSAVINSNLSGRMRGEGCSLVRELQHTDMREMSDVFKLYSSGGKSTVFYRWLLGSSMGAAEGFNALFKSTIKGFS